MDLRRGVAAAAVGVVVLSVAMGLRERQRTAALERNAVTVEPARTYAFRPVVVVGRRPTLSEILDLVLHERPTAAQLGKSVTTGFPAGSDEAHIASILNKYTKDAGLVNRISASLVKEGRRRHIGSSLLVGVLLTENPWLDPRATSSVGARGLMQVMPFHAGKWGCSSRDLFDVESNICHGVAILADNLSQSKSLPQALLGYNGCVRGTNTPNCWRYPGTVYRQARKGDAGAFRRGL
jgi:hypothetical protein